MASVLSHNLSQIEKVSIFMDECKRMGLNVLSPDVNESYDQFMVNAKGEIRFAMAAIKGVGDSAVDSIIKERTDNGVFTDIFDFYKRISLRTVNKKAIENLVMAGGFDSFGFKRAQYFNCPDGATTILETLHKFGTKVQNESGSGVLSLFGDMDEYKIDNPSIPECARWSDIETANKEKELIGMYLTSHPLDEYKLYIDSFCTSTKQMNENMAEFLNKDITLAGIITEAREGMTKKGNPYAIFKIEDFTETFEIPLFGKDFIGFKNHIIIGTSIFIKGKVQKKSWGDGNQLDFKILAIDLLNEMKEQLIKNVNIQVDASMITDELTAELYSCFEQNPGNIDVSFSLYDAKNPNISMYSRKCKINISSELLQYFAKNDAINIKIS
jgi:DNA polymerase-3 subunit alpha